MKHLYVLMKYLFYFTKIMLITILVMATASCDDGRIYDEEPTDAGREGRTVRFSAEIQGSDTYSGGLILALAGFSKETEFAEISKNIPEGSVELEMDGVPPDVERVELCIINSLRKRVATIASVDISDREGTIEFNAGQRDVSSGKIVEREVFTASCKQCHGATGYAAASLSLLEGESSGNLIGIESTVMPGMKRVVAGDIAASVLWMALDSDISDGWAFSHRELLDADRKSLVKSWILSISNN